MLARHHDWPERLIAFIELRRHMPFAWGSNDCGLFYADAVIDMTIDGHDIAARLRGYTTAADAMRRIKSEGGMLAAALASGCRQKPAGFAQRGDGVLVELEGRDTFGVVAGNGMWCGPGEQGLVFRPMAEVRTVIEV